jgi:cell division protein FtsB
MGFLKAKLKQFEFYLLGFLGLVLAVSLVRNLLKINQIRQRVAKNKERVEKFKNENRQMETKIGEVTSQEYLEKQLRDKLGLSKEGETIVILPDAETLRKLVPEIPQEEETLPEPPWQKWLRIFGV